MQRVHDRPIWRVLANHKSLHQIHILWWRKKKSVDGELQESEIIDGGV